MDMDQQLMTVPERHEFLEANRKWLGDMMVAEFGFYDYTEGLGVSDVNTKEILAERMRLNQPWIP